MVLIPGRHRFELLDIRVGLPGASGQKLILFEQNHQKEKTSKNV